MTLLGNFPGICHLTATTLALMYVISSERVKPIIRTKLSVLSTAFMQTMNMAIVYLCFEWSQSISIWMDQWSCACDWIYSPWKVHNGLEHCCPFTTKIKFFRSYTPNKYLFFWSHFAWFPVGYYDLFNLVPGKSNIGERIFPLFPPTGRLNHTSASYKIWRVWDIVEDIGGNRDTCYHKNRERSNKIKNK